MIEWFKAKKEKIFTILWNVGTLFLLFSFIFCAVAFALQVNFKDYDTYDKGYKASVVLAMLFPMLSVIINITCAIVMFIDANKFQNEETIKGLCLESFLVMPILFAFAIIAFYYWWVYLLALITTSVGFHMFYKSIRIALEIKPKKEPIVIPDIEN